MGTRCHKSQQSALACKARRRYQQTQLEDTTKKTYKYDADCRDTTTSPTIAKTTAATGLEASGKALFDLVGGTTASQRIQARVNEEVSAIHSQTVSHDIPHSPHNQNGNDFPTPLGRRPSILWMQHHSTGSFGNNLARTPRSAGLEWGTGEGKLLRLGPWRWCMEGTLHTAIGLPNWSTSQQHKRCMTFPRGRLTFLHECHGMIQ